MLCSPSTHTTNRLWSHAFCECTCTARIITSLGHLGFTRYKAPFCEALGAAVEDGFLPTCRRSYEDFWLPMLNYDTPAYNAKTRELPWEREPSVFFSALPSLAHEVPAEPTEPAVSDDSDAEDDEEPEPKKKRWLPIAVIAALLAAIGAVVYFLINWYFVDMTQLNILSSGTDRMVVELVSADDPNRFVLTCTDSYGNAYPGTCSANQYTFTGLSEKTTYTVSVSAAQYHKLLNADSYTINVTTPESTLSQT